MGNGLVSSLAHHQVLLADTVRTNAFRRALAAVVRPGMVVADLGCGSGILSLLACQAGAARVYAVEATAIVNVAADLAAANGFGERITFLHEDARTVELPEPVDVAVSEWLGSFAVNDGMYEVAARLPGLLREGGTVMPGVTRLHVAPVAESRLDDVGFWAEPRYDLDLHPALLRARHVPHHLSLFAEELCGPVTEVGTIDGYATDGVRFRGAGTVPVTAPYVLGGLAGWFTAELAPDISVTNRPGTRNHWGQLAFPVEPVHVEPDDELRFAVEYDGPGDGQECAWSVEVARGGHVVHRSEHDMRLALAPGSPVR